MATDVGAEISRLLVIPSGKSLAKSFIQERFLHQGHPFAAVEVRDKPLDGVSLCVCVCVCVWVLLVCGVFRGASANVNQTEP